MSFDLDGVSFIGQDLCRPECVLATKAGNLYVSDFRGGVTLIARWTIIFGGQEVEMRKTVRYPKAKRHMLAP